MKLFYEEASNKPGIYKIINTHTDRIYIGQAKYFKQRWASHIASLKNGKHQNKFLKHDFDKCLEELGHDNFIEFHVLEVMEGSIKEERNKREEEVIAEYYDNQDRCYNFKKKTVQKERSCHSLTPEETRQKHSETMKKIWQDEKYREKSLPVMTEANRKRTEENPSSLQKALEARLKRQREDPKFQNLVANNTKKQWEENKEKMLEIVTTMNSPEIRQKALETKRKNRIKKLQEHPLYRRYCIQCGKEFLLKNLTKQQLNKQFCSTGCALKHPDIKQKKSNSMSGNKNCVGRTPWNKNKTGYKLKRNNVQFLY